MSYRVLNNMCYSNNNLHIQPSIMYTSNHKYLYPNEPIYNQMCTYMYHYPLEEHKKTEIILKNTNIEDENEEDVYKYRKDRVRVKEEKKQHAIDRRERERLSRENTERRNNAFCKTCIS